MTFGTRWLQHGAALLWRDLWHWRWLPLAALLLGLLPLIVAAFSADTAYGSESIREATVIVVLAFFGPLMLFNLGATMFGRDLAEKRLDFYLVRPLGPWLLWSVRCIAAWLISILSLILLALPVALLSPALRVLLPESREHAIPWSALSEYFSVSQLLTEQHYPRPLGLPWALLLALLVLLTVILISHVVGTVLRSRSSWLLLDILGLALALLLLFFVRDQMIAAEAFGLMVWLERGLILAVPALLWLAGGFQIAEGRGDLKRGHRIMTLMIWPAFLLLAGLLVLVAGWAASPSIDDLEGFEWAHQSPQEGRWLAVGGALRGRAGQQGVFLLDTESGESLHLGGMVSVAPWLRFAPDGSRVLWLRCERFGYEYCEIWTKDLVANSEPRPTGIKMRDLEAQVEVSPAGDLVAISGWRRLEVHALAAGRLVAALQMPRTLHHSFRPGGFLRFIKGVTEPGESPTELMELDLGSRKVERLGILSAFLDAPHGLLSPDADLLLSRSLFPHRLQLIDMTTGSLVCDLLAAETELPGRVGDAMFVSSHRLALLSSNYSSAGPKAALGKRWLTVVEVRRGDKDEWLCEPGHLVELPDAEWAFFGAFLPPDVVTLGMRTSLDEDDQRLSGPLDARGLAPLENWQTMQFHLGDLTLSKLGDGFVPMAPWHRGQQGQGQPLVAISSPLYLAADRAVFRWSQPGEPEQAQVVLPPAPDAAHSSRVHF